MSWNTAEDLRLGDAGGEFCHQADHQITSPWWTSPANVKKTVTVGASVNAVQTECNKVEKWRG